MQLIEPSAELLGEVPTDYAGNMQFVERAGRTCYKSEGKGDPEKFVRKLITSGHLAMVEHSNFVVQIDDPIARILQTTGKFLNTHRNEFCTYVGGNLTAWFQQERSCVHYASVFRPFKRIYRDLFDMPSYLCGEETSWRGCASSEVPDELKRYSVKFTCDRGVSHELVRHRLCSFAQESTRYVNYEGKDMEFIEPAGFASWTDEEKYPFLRACALSEGFYGRVLRLGMKPQQARAILPNALKTELIVTADAAEWAHIKKLRTARDAHPDMQRIMNLVPWSLIC